jgi:hypothetical protein
MKGLSSLSAALFFAREIAMPARFALFATVFLWLAYESHFSPKFFVATVETSLSDIFGGIEHAIAAEYPATVRTAAKDDRAF